MTHDERNQVIALNERLDPPYRVEGEIDCPICGCTDLEVLCGRAYCQNPTCDHWFDLSERGE